MEGFEIVRINGGTDKKMKESLSVFMFFRKEVYSVRCCGINVRI